MSVDTSSATATPGVDPARARVAGAIKQAASSTGVSFEYMLATAKMESDFNPTAGASTSSAKGLYQFIEQTWLGTVKEAGGQLGYGQYADAISKTSSGDYVVKDENMRRSIMKLRDDPVASSAMASEACPRIRTRHPSESSTSFSARWLLTSSSTIRTPTPTSATKLS